MGVVGVGVALGIAFRRLVVCDSAVEIGNFRNLCSCFLLRCVPRSALSASLEAAGDPSVQLRLDLVPSLLQSCNYRHSISPVSHNHAGVEIAPRPAVTVRPISLRRFVRSWLDQQMQAERQEGARIVASP